MSNTQASTQLTDLEGPIKLYVENGKGTVEVTATDTDVATVDITGPDVDQVRVDFEGGELSVVVPQQRGGFLGGDKRYDIVITVPTGSDVATKLGSADLTTRGAIGTTNIRSGSGDVDLETAMGPALVETGSGDVTIERAEQPLRVKSGSGDVTAHHTAAEVSISTGSGDVEIGESLGATQVKTGSGDLKIGHGRTNVALTTGSGDLTVERFTSGQIQMKGASGDVRLGIPAGVPVWTDVSTVSGRIHSTLEGAGQPEPGADYVEVRAKTVSGDIDLRQI